MYLDYLPTQLMLQKRKAEESEEGELGDPDLMAMMGFFDVFRLFTYLTNVAEEEGGGE
jgi:hypothetical protein